MSAIDRQKTFEQEDAFACAARSVVMLDEAGLPKEKEMPLKVLQQFGGKVLVINLLLGFALPFGSPHCIFCDSIKQDFRCCQNQQNLTTFAIRHFTSRFEKTRKVQYIVVLAGVFILTILFRGCIFGQTVEIGKKDDAILAALCDSYLECNQFSEKTRKELFHLRDFVHMMRYLRKKATVNTHFDITPDILLRALQVMIFICCFLKLNFFAAQLQWHT